MLQELEAVHFLRHEIAPKLKQAGFPDSHNTAAYQRQWQYPDWISHLQARPLLKALHGFLLPTCYVCRLYHEWCAYGYRVAEAADASTVVLGKMSKPALTAFLSPAQSTHFCLDHCIRPMLIYG